MGLFAAFPFATQFMIYAKGISLELFFAISSFFCVVFFLKGLSPKKYLLLYVLANGCGIYAMPTHVYWWILQWVFSVFYILVYRKKLLKSFLIGNMLVLLFGLFCYLPVIAGSGITFVTGAAWGPNDLPDLSPDTGSFILLANLYFTGSGYGFGIALLMAIVVLAVSKKYGVAYFFLIAFGLALLILPLAIRLLQHIHIPERAVGFVGLAMPIIAFIVFSLGKDFLPDFLRAGLAIFLFASMLLVSHFHSFRFWSAKHDKNAIAISNLMMQHHVIRCYDNAPGSGFYYYYPALEFYYAQHKLNIELSLAAPNSLRHKVFSVADDYDCLVDSLNANDAAYSNNYGVIYTDSGEGFRVLLKQGN
jgi:hypothetical protein